MIPVYVSQDSTVTDVLLQLITRSGSYIDMSNCRWLIVQGAVSFEGVVQKNTAAKPGLGPQTVVVDSKRYLCDVRLSAYE